MKIAVQGSKNFSDYTIFLRAMRTALYSMSEDDREITIYGLGPVRVNNMATEFSNVSEDGLRARGIRISFRKVPLTWFEKNVKTINYFAFFSKPGEPISKLVELGDKAGIDVGVYTYE